jgi:hypothetical protein
MELTKQFTNDQYDEALESWQWLDLRDKAPLFTSLFGDVFFEAADGCWYLDSLGGKLTRPWATRLELDRTLATDDGRDQYLLADVAAEAQRRGIVLGPAQVYDFTTPPVLGGAIDAGNVTANDFVVALHVAGQIHDQVRNIPPGTRIASIE